MRRRYRFLATLLPLALPVAAAVYAGSVLAAAPGSTEADPGQGVPQTGAPATTDQLARGKAVFEEWCAGCHAPGPRHPGTQALDALYKGKKPGTLEERTDLVPKLTETFVRKGVSVMPPWFSSASITLWYRRDG